MIQGVILNPRESSELLAVQSWGGRYPTSIWFPALSTLNSEESEVKGTSMNWERWALSGPEYLGLGTNTALPVVSKDLSSQGPSTTFHSGLVAKVFSFLAWLTRKFHTALAPEVVVS